MHVRLRPWIVPFICLILFVSASRSFADDKPVTEPATIVMLGDSTTAPRAGVLMVYAGRIEHALTAAGNSVKVVNAGVPGDTTEGAGKRFAKDVLDHKPDLVVIQLGANDSAMDVWKTPPVTKPRVSKERFNENLRWMIDALEAAGSKVVLMTTNQFRWTPKLKELYGKPPYDPTDPEGFTNATLRSYNTVVRKLAEEKKLPLVDVLAEYDAYQKKTGKSPDFLLLDGMHPNDWGQELVADLLLPVIYDVLPLKRSPVKEVLALPPSKENPRNSEGDFIRLKDGRILFVYTHFTGGGGDHSKAHLAGRFSSDEGKTWTDEDVVVIPYEGGLNNMSVSLLRLQDGRIALFYARKQALTDCRPYLRFSDDEGKTWSDPIVCVPDSDVGYYVLNNDRAVQLKSGRLILPLALHHRPDWEKPDWAGHIVCYYSDDAGKTWKRSKSTLITNTPAGKRVTTQEPGVVELKDGRVMMFVRTGEGMQYVSYSSDGGDTWSELKPSNMAGPCAPASIERIPGSGELFLVWNNHANIDPALKGRRTPMTIAVSRDEGKTWENVRNIAWRPHGWYCYTAIEFVDGAVLLGHCAGDRRTGGLSRTAVTRIPLDFVLEGGR